MDLGERVLRGPFSITGWLVAVGWLGVAALAWWRLAEPWSWVVMGLSVVAAIATGLVSRGLTVRVSETGVSGVGLPEIAWEDIDHVGVRTGLVNVPFVSVRRGRALEQCALDGIASVSRRAAVKLAEQVADAGELGEVVVLGRSAPTRGRRGIE